MKKYLPWLVIAGLVLVLAAVVMVNRPKVEAMPAPTPEQIEEQDIVKKIQSGSLAWKNANEQAVKWETERTRQAEGTRGYRYTLCTKFGKIVDTNGAVALAGNPMQGAPDCSSFQ